MLSYFPLLCILLFLPSFLPAGISDLAADRNALLLLRRAVFGRTIQWNLSEPSPCSWRGVNCTSNRVTDLRLPGSGLSGQIPSNSIGNLTNLRTLSLRRNSLSGLPSDLASCTELKTINLQENNFSGDIPAILFNLTNLVSLDLSGNNFAGEVSLEFNKLTELRTLYMENNQLTGLLPEFSNLSSLVEFNISSNRLNGSIPSYFQRFSSNAFLGNSLCGLPLNACPNQGSEGTNLSGGAIAGIVIGSVISLLFVLLLSFFLCRNYRIRPQADTPPVRPPESAPQSPQPGSRRANRGLDDGLPVAAPVGTRPRNVSRSDGLVFFNEGNGVFGFEELLTASAEVLRKGSVFGTTYKAYLGKRNEVIVKRLKNVSVSEWEFRAKVEELGKIAHENLVPLKGYYYGREEKLLVYDCMPLGSLSQLLYENRASTSQILTWEVRTRIAFQAARGVKHLHSLNITHGNIKPSNIFLIDDQYTPSISEYGITQLLSSTSSPDSIGYRAPELTESHKISEPADVYSFGVVLLELLIDRAPSNPVTGEKIDLVRKGKSMAEGNLELDLFDPDLLKYHHVKEQIFQFLFVAISCTTQDPEGRPTMEKVTGLLKRIHVFSKQGY